MSGLDRFIPGRKRSEPEVPESAGKEPIRIKEMGKEISKDDPYAQDDNETEEVSEEVAEELEAERYAEVPEQEEVIERTIFEAESPKNTGPLSLLSVTYSGSKAKAQLKFYDLDKKKIVFWYDKDRTADDEGLKSIKSSLAEKGIKTHILNNNFFETKKLLENDDIQLHFAHQPLILLKKLVLLFFEKEPLLFPVPLVVLAPFPETRSTRLAIAVPN